MNSIQYRRAEACARPLDPVLESLKRVRKSGSGWVACCPSHDDRNPSLSIREGSDGRVLLHCHAGCTLHEITAAIGMTPADLFPRDGRPAPAHGVARAELRDAARFEGTVAFIVAADRRKGKQISADDAERERLAIQRIAAARRFGC